MCPEARERREVAVRGMVQGVGFRPFVYSLARRHDLGGWVRNDSDGVQIEVEGRRERVEAFLRLLTEEQPPLAVVEAVCWQPLPVRGEREFRIEASRDGASHRALVSPDVATCGECLRELFDPADRRYRYPFINCTNCGPRFTITRSVPYDRPLTTMAAFPMCDACRREYDDPADRRFHAQPNACPECGPRVRLLDASGGQLDAGDPLAAAARLLRQGAILAVKGLGGYHLACDPFSEAAVGALRRRKARQDKPFAVMAELAEVRELCDVAPAEEALLTDPARPIVLLVRRRAAGSAGARIDAQVAPRQARLGVMLAYTPLHHLLLHEAGMPLVMTSGNRSDEPIAYRDEEALAQLGGIADGFLVHNRAIHMRCDDSVLSPPVPDGRPRPGTPFPPPLFIRRSRGHAPRPLSVAAPFSRPLLACGGELKAAFCLGREGHALLSHHIGDLENYETLRSYREAVDHYCRLFDLRPEAVACDLHPQYLSTQYAQGLAESGLALVGVQHHEAHVASCLADNERPDEERVIGVALDGTGYGADGAIWGGELFTGSLRDGFTRRGHLQYVPLPGGAAAIRQPWRMALAYLLAAYGPGESARLAVEVIRSAGTRRVGLIFQMIERGINSPPTSSTGRLFDAVAALLGLAGTEQATYEGQAAMELELAAGGARDEACYPLPALKKTGDLRVLETPSLIRGVIEDLRAGRSRERIAARFHASLAAGVAACCAQLARADGIRAAALSGGAFQNQLLTALLAERLQAEGLTVYTHRRVPANDGGLALGQAVLADRRLRD